MENTKKPSIKHRMYSTKVEGEFSSLKYEIIADGSIIREMYKVLQKISDKYPKDWEKNIKCESKG